ncbi:MAG: hexokinase [Spirochaetaceae bacterium]|jgi:hexokinase|nr:hexokinase [Spirochaetaceae bacterium]
MNCFDPKALIDFAHYHGFHYDICNPHALVQDIASAMQRGLCGQSSSLAMLPSYLTPVQTVPTGKTVIALDAGGTNFRAALVHFDTEGKAIPEQTKRVSMPGTQGQVTAEEFFDRFAALTAPLLEQCPSVCGIGFCFSYPTRIDKDADGTVLSFSKEVDAPEVIGKKVGEGLREALIRRGLNVPQRIVLLNDTVATLLSGLIAMKDSGTGPVIGTILGTGYNTAYPEWSIPKIGFESAQKPYIVVCETGTFAHRYQGYIDKEFDSTTKNPGAYSLEKACSGAYLGPLFLHIVKTGIKDGVLRFNKQDEFASWSTLQTKDLNAFLRDPYTKEGALAGLFAADESDARSAFTYLAALVTERAALLAAAPIAAAVKRLAVYDPLNPARIAIEGTTYFIYHGMRVALDSWLHVMLSDEQLHPYSIMPVEQASLFGAAVAALTSGIA